MTAEMLCILSFSPYKKYWEISIAPIIGNEAKKNVDLASFELFNQSNWVSCYDIANPQWIPDYLFIQSLLRMLH